MEIYKSEWQNIPDTITVSREYFISVVNSINDDNDNSDRLYKIGDFLYYLEATQRKKYNELITIFVDRWNASLDDITKWSKEDEELSTINDVHFKWGHLVDQEICMWAKLCCYTHAKIDCENLIYEIAQVELEDFESIVLRRGFSNNMVKFMIRILKEMGIGNNLKNGDE